jgi:CBS domain containing-hemolysin-like protein
VSSLGKIAKAGDVAFVDDITIRVISTVGRRINRVNILKSDTE